MNKLLVATALTVTISAASSSPSIAQADDRFSPMGGACPNAMGESMPGPGTMGAGAMGTRTSHLASVVANRLAYLKDNLRITAAQNDAWNGYADALTGRIDAMQSARTAMMNAVKAGTAVDRMNARIAGMQAIVDAMKTSSPAISKLYAVLTIEQKKIADELMDCGAM